MPPEETSTRTSLSSRKSTSTRKSVSTRKSIGGFDIDMDDYVFETPDHKKDPTIPTTAEAKRILQKCVETSDPEYARKHELGIYSKSARKEREERRKIPKTPRLPVSFLVE